ncbi:WYL domain-containing protein [Leisingera sp. JC1]|uniref:WYL domain-containing protein n=1 Tax=Leisingera sp. JC1 TaxID=1855282 RepID=UPI00113142E4|nr:WYL domain-containing protein [Leisingera sp. JC1]
MEALHNLKSNIRRRFEFIEFCLNWDGKVGRPQLQDQFSISPQQATNDLTTYLDACPGNMNYDPRQRAYIANSNFKPRLISGEASEYFMHLEMLAKNYRTEGEIWINNIPQVSTVSVSSRPLSKVTVKAVVQAINTESALLCEYASISSGSNSERTLSPTALVSDGHRWHIRAYHFEKQRFGDYVLTRMSRARVAPLPDQPVPADDEWADSVTIEFSPARALNGWRRAQLEHEYEMKSGKLRVSTTKALLFYVLRQYGFNPYDLEENGMMRNVSSFQLEVSNLDEVEECLRRRA